MTEHQRTILRDHAHRARRPLRRVHSCSDHSVLEGVRVRPLSDVLQRFSISTLSEAPGPRVQRLHVSNVGYSLSSAREQVDPHMPNLGPLQSKTPNPLGAVTSHRCERCRQELHLVRRHVSPPRGGPMRDVLSGLYNPQSPQTMFA